MTGVTMVDRETHYGGKATIFESIVFLRLSVFQLWMVLS